MEYIVAGVLATLAMLAYRGSVAPGALAASSAPGERLCADRTGLRGNAGSCVAIGTSFAILFGVAACRRGVGTDYWPRYVPFFQQAAQGWPVETDAGYVLLNRVVAFFTNDYQWIFVVTSAATIALVYRAIVRLSLNPALSIFIFVFGGFYLESFNLVRQWLAIAILLNTVEALILRRALPFVLLTLVASTLHGSALIWLLIWPLGQTWSDWRVRVAVMVATISAVLVVPGAVQGAVSALFPSYAWYFSSNYGEVRAFDPYGMAVAFGIVVASTVLLARGNRHQPSVHALMNLQAVQIVVLAMAAGVVYAFSRMTYYFTPVQMFIVPLMLARIDNQRARWWASVLVLVAYAVCFYFKFIVWNSHGALPYESIF